MMVKEDANQPTRDKAVELWLHDEVAKAFDALKADPAQALTVEAVRSRLLQEHTTTR